MATDGTQSLISPDRIKIEGGLTEDEPTDSKRSVEVGDEIPKIGQSGTAQTSHSDSNNATISTITLSVKREPEISATERNGQIDLARMSVSVDLVAQVKEDIEDKVSITRELVRYMDGSSNLKKEISGLNNEGETSQDNSSGNRFKSATSSDLMDDESLLNIHFPCGTSTQSCAEVKEENEGKRDLTYKLVDILPNTLNIAVKTDINSEKDVGESCKNDRIEIHFEQVPLFVPDKGKVDTVKTMKKSHRTSEAKSNIRYNSDCIKLVDVSVVVEDLFSTNDRRLGKAHTNSETCACIYCRHQYKCMRDSQPENCRSSVSRERRFECDLCLANFKKKCHLKRHLQTHSSERPFSCKVCSAAFKNNYTLVRHTLRHTSERPFKCTICSQGFKHKSNLKWHSVVHSSEKPFRCEQCSATFNYKGNLTVHKRIHGGEKPFSCKLCAKSFTFRSNLQVHTRCVHSNERPFKCKYCSATFKRKFGLLEHEQSHSSEHPFKCNLCSLRFKVKSNLNKHLKVHNCERPFICAHCSATFKHKNVLKGHLRIHTGEKPFSCELCSKIFSWKSDLKKHMKLCTAMKDVSLAKHALPLLKHEDIKHHIRKRSSVTQ